MPMCEHEALCALHSSRAELRRDVAAGSNKMEGRMTVLPH